MERWLCDNIIPYSNRRTADITGTSSVVTLRTFLTRLVPLRTFQTRDVLV
ncbi:hypothetical protein T12_4153 [Trichinella patagoniensis]|uniref:Uncharacterized protein n=1 Tax=Trichinella patagoniensis TaxID=990121 RepID=A0A0V0YQC6_9BILA|nr:hypothetical protein T12_4153 [Trichinella patagoniensis]